MRLKSVYLLCLSKRNFTYSLTIKTTKLQPSPPKIFELDGISLSPDEKWNLSPAVLRTLQRRLLFEVDNPLSLLKQRIVNFIYGKYQMKGGMSPQFAVIDNQPRAVSVFDNFDSLLVPANHVSRSVQDTYYINKDYCLRAHTSAHQHSLISQGLDNFLVIGDVYRRDAVDSLHFPCFHQVEGVRLFTAAELFNDPLNRYPKSLFVNDKRTAEKQEQHTKDVAEYLIKDLKATLETLCHHIFGSDYDIRWVNADFPFTYPSFELEIYCEDKWIEVLGCGVMEQNILKMAGVVDKVGWAFGLGLERLAMVLYGIPDIRLFWSRDSGFLTQFAGKSPNENFKYMPISIHPQVFYDVSFWLPEDIGPEEMAAETYDLIRSIGDQLIEQVKIIDTFEHPKTKKMSQTYRLVYRSHDEVLTKEEESKRSPSFDIDTVVKNHEKWIEHTAAMRAKESDPGIYRMILPPPNVTGNLHLGHALTVTVEDAICRYRRLQGQKVIWYPGFDHAGIATQLVVERMLWNKKKLRRHQVTQQDFLELCQRWKDERVADISKQLKALGATLDWHNMYYTLDDRFSEAVIAAFCQLYNDGLIFNDLRMVNWCPTLRSTISNQEVDIVDVGKNDYFPINESGLKRKYIEVGVMHRIRYELLDRDSLSGSNYLEVGTTRPETLFADCALAVNPSDERYVKYIGLRVRHPLLPDRTLPILADAAVKIDKGTGILKITPAHNFTDFAIARNHTNQLSDEDFSRSCVDESGCLINAADFNGMNRFEARNKVITKLIACDKYGGTIPYHEQQLRVCSRTGDIIEPMAKKQWFMDCLSVNDIALRAIERGLLTVTPKYMQKHLENWLNEKEPWCLSRQLDWGQRIPAFRPDSNSKWIVAHNEAEALHICGEIKSKMDLEQDKDVLDTWFCSSLIPIVTSGWPRKQIDRIPLSLLETGYDIVGFWVARMIVVCYSLTGYLPFPKVVLHGLVRDENGRKMSKSLGNVIDPMDVVDGISLQKMLERLDKSSLSETEKKMAASSLRSRFREGISRHGPDALRFALLRYDVNAMDINIDIIQTAGEGLKFCNKLWNLCNYAEEIWRNCCEVSDQICNERIEDCWIKSRLESSLLIMNEKMDSDCPHLALSALHRFFCNDLCDVYIETTKKALWLKDYPRLKVVAEILHDVTEKSLIHLSIFMPFVSQYLFDRVKREKDNRTFVFSSKDSKPYFIDKKLEQDMSFVLEVVKAIRSIRAQFRISAKNTLQVACYGENCELKNFRTIIQELCNVSLFSTVSEENSNYCLPFPVHGYSAEIHVIIAGDYSSLVKKELLRRLQKAEKRKGQFLHQIDKHDKLARSATRDDLMESHHRKISQANVALNTVMEEISKLGVLIKRLEAF
ncbi:putative valine--tRNA ligase [Dirofilaria immitis]